MAVASYEECGRNGDLHYCRAAASDRSRKPARRGRWCRAETTMRTSIGTAEHHCTIQKEPEESSACSSGMVVQILQDGWYAFCFGFDGAAAENNKASSLSRRRQALRVPPRAKLAGPSLLLLCPAHLPSVNSRIRRRPPQSTTNPSSR